MKVCSSGFLELTKILHKSGGHINRRYKMYYHRDVENASPIGWAIIGGHLDVVKYLTNQGAVIGIQSRERKGVVEIAAEKGHKDIVAFVKDNPQILGKN